MRAASKYISAILLVVAGVLVFGSCKDDTTDPAVPRNVISGVADGRSFTATRVGTAKDSNDVFLMGGSLGRSGSFLAAFAGREETEYQIAEEGALVALTNYLNELIARDSFFIDTMALEEIFSDSTQLLPDGTAFIYYIPDQVPYFSRRGNITLTRFDGSINRIYGSMEGEFINAEGGPKYLNAFFEDMFYVDCPLVNSCF